jgi:hypothetical protein
VSANRHPLRRVFDSAERAVGAPLESLVASRRFTDVAVLALRTQGLGARMIERQSRAVLHFWNMPARSDVQRVNRQIAALTNEVRALSARLDEGDERRGA